MDRGVWGATVHGVTKSQTEWLSLFSTGNYTWYLVVTYNGENSGKEYIYKHIYIYWRRQWHPTLVLLPGKPHGWRSLVGCSPWGREDWATSLSLFTFMWNVNPLQYSCLENPRDRGAWWAAVYGVAQSWTRLKWLRSSTIYCWERLKAQGEEGDRGWDGWMITVIQWTWTSGQTPGDGEGQRGLACYSPWCCKELDMTWWLNSNNSKYYI